jgi:hypothetical protein
VGQREAGHTVGNRQILVPLPESYRTQYRSLVTEHLDTMNVPFTTVHPSSHTPLFLTSQTPGARVSLKGYKNRGRGDADPPKQRHRQPLCPLAHTSHGQANLLFLIVGFADLTSAGPS